MSNCEDAGDSSRLLTIRISLCCVLRRGQGLARHSRSRGTGVFSQSCLDMIATVFAEVSQPSFSVPGGHISEIRGFAFR